MLGLSEQTGCLVVVVSGRNLRRFFLAVSGQLRRYLTESRLTESNTGLYLTSVRGPFV